VSIAPPSPRAGSALLLGLGLLLTACDQDGDASFEQCELDLVLEPASADIGQEVTATGRPQSGDLDTAVRVDGMDAQVVSVDIPEACALCDACRDDAGCVSCETCADCDESCGDCTPGVTFVVPAVEPGLAGVVVTNRYGTSPVLDLQVTDPTE